MFSLQRTELKGSWCFCSWFKKKLHEVASPSVQGGRGAGGGAWVPGGRVSRTRGVGGLQNRALELCVAACRAPVTSVPSPGPGRRPMLEQHEGPGGDVGRAGWDRGSGVEG